ncbi:MAG: Zn-ribbon domain-containing OB-fold protein [Acidimicrobiales bacterium]
MRVAAHPGLYDPAKETPTLTGSRCTACDRVAFPPITIGCDACGAEDLSTNELEATGTLYSFATVHLHQGDLEAPFSIAEVQLDAGPLIRATMAPDQVTMSIGQRVHAVWRVARAEDNGDEVVEPVFAPLAR